MRGDSLREVKYCTCICCGITELYGGGAERKQALLTSQA